MLQKWLVLVFYRLAPCLTVRLLTSLKYLSIRVLIVRNTVLCVRFVDMYFRHYHRGGAFALFNGPTLGILYGPAALWGGICHLMKKSQMPVQCLGGGELGELGIDRATKAIADMATF